MNKIRVTIEFETISPEGALTVVRETQEQELESSGELESIDSCEKHLLATSYEAMRLALGSQLSEVSKKKTQTHGKKNLPAPPIECGVK